MSASSDFIRLINAKVNIYHNAKICGNWQVDAQHIGRTFFHVITEGYCKLSRPNCNAQELGKGDVVLFPREIDHRLSPLHPVQGDMVSKAYSQGSDEGTGLLCASVELNAGAGKYLLEAMPEVMILRNDETNPWLPPLNTLLQSENYQQGPLGEVVIQRLCELLFIYALTYCLENKKTQSGILKLYSHPKLNKALEAIHKNPSESWSLEALAQQAAMSRTAFANAFKDQSGWTPVQYLTWWRMQLAWSRLHKGESVARVAGEVGYQSQAAFSRAFKSEFSQSAGQVRKSGAA